MSKEISVVFVSFRSADLLSDAIRTARSSSSRPLEVVVVDNSCDDREHARLDAVGADEIIISETNQGFAAGLNQGVARANGNLILSANPDVVFGSSSIDYLADTVEGEVGAAGPRFFWDEDWKWLLPPPEAATRRERARGLPVLSNLRGIFEPARIRRRLAYWKTDQARSVPTLSGAVMMLRRSSFDQLGGMDERFTMYFEEVDYLRRLRRSGRSVIFQPAAKCRHMFGKSAVQNERSREWFAESERSFHIKWHGAGFWKATSGRAGESRKGLGKVRGTRLKTDGSTHLELAQDQLFTMAAGNLSGDEMEIPREAVRGSGLNRVFLREIDTRRAKVLWAGEAKLEAEE